jgi:hypothetical protein
MKNPSHLIAALMLIFTSPTGFATPDSNADLNGDVLVDSRDISKLSSCFGQVFASNTACDVALADEDDDIDMDDFSFVSDRLGQAYPWMLYHAPMFDMGHGKLGDVNKDGITDVVSLRDGLIQVWLSNGDSSFRKGQRIAIEYTLEWDLIDVNRDNTLDLVGIPPLGGLIIVLLGSGDGRFQAPLRSTIGGDYGLAAMGDVDGDGNIDALISHPSGHEFSLLPGNGDGTFQTPLSPFSVKVAHHFSSCLYSCTLELGDFNNDGKLDALAVDTWGDGVTVMLGSGDGRFQMYQRTQVGIYVKQAKVDDLNGDGLLDAAVLFSFGVKIMLNQGNGDLKWHHTINTDTADRVFLGDINADKRSDILVSGGFNDFVAVSLNLGDGNFNKARNLVTSYQRYCFHKGLGDFNADGLHDIMVSCSDGDVVIMGNGDGSFQMPHHFEMGQSVTPEEIADLDGDGALDKVSVNPASNNVSVWLNRNGNAQEEQRFATGEGPRSVTLRDVNGDGYLDGVVSNEESDDISILLNNGNGWFQQQHRMTVGDAPGAGILGDLNGDKKPDLVIANWESNDVSVLLGKGNGDFYTQLRFEANTRPKSLSVDDLNGDGILDIMVTETGVSVLLGRGDGTFYKAQKFLGYECNMSQHCPEAM